MTMSELTEEVCRCGSNRVNWYLVEDDDSPTVIDTGFPTHWQGFLHRLDDLGHDRTDIEACLLIHAPPDHIGFAKRVRETCDASVWLHPADVPRAQAGGEPPLGGMIKNLWRPAILRYFIEVVQSEGTSIQPVRPVERVHDSRELEVPGMPVVIHVPGHTAGEVAFYLPDRDVPFCGDAPATVDFETWRDDTPQLLPQWLNTDHDRARASLSDLESPGDVLLLPGHGDPSTVDLTDALR
jgi:glyoxylase-like metal-dependent hydrolase (beta-lactamase superfamily II)